MRVFVLIALVTLFGPPQEGAVILSRDEIDEGYYDEVPADLLGASNWLGLYVTDDDSRVEETRVEFIPHEDGDFTVFKLVTDPANAVLLFAGVPALSPGVAVTVSRWPVSLNAREPEMELSLGARAYVIRLTSADQFLCDAVITLNEDDRSQILYEPGNSEFACDEPHFDVSWAGDLDRDGRLDLLVSLSSKYSYHPRQLFLSSVAGDGELVSEAGRSERFAG